MIKIILRYIDNIYFLLQDEIDELKRKAKPECKICVDLGADRVLSCGHLLCKLCYAKCTDTDIYCLDITGPFLRKLRFSS